MSQHDENAWPFEILEVGGTFLDERGLNLELADWWVLCQVDADDGLYGHTNASALTALLNEAGGPDAARMVQTTWYSQYLVLLNPAATAIKPLAAYSVAMMEAGNHHDPVLYRRAVRECCAERWLELDDADRVELLLAHGLSPRFALSDQLAEEVVPCLAPLFE